VLRRVWMWSMRRRSSCVALGQLWGGYRMYTGSCLRWSEICDSTISSGSSLNCSVSTARCSFFLLDSGGALPKPSHWRRTRDSIWCILLLSRSPSGSSPDGPSSISGAVICGIDSGSKAHRRWEGVPLKWLHCGAINGKNNNLNRALIFGVCLTTEASTFGKFCNPFSEFQFSATSENIEEKDAHSFVWRFQPSFDPSPYLRLVFLLPLTFLIFWGDFSTFFLRPEPGRIESLTVFPICFLFFFSFQKWTRPA